MKNKILLFLFLGVISQSVFSQDNYLWNFSYDMKIKSIKFKTESNERNDFLKEKINNILKENHQVCASNNKDVKKEIKKLFPGCNFYYENNDNQFTSNISCDKLDYSMTLTPKTQNDFRGSISLDTSNEEFELNASGSLFLKRGKPCN